MSELSPNRILYGTDEPVSAPVCLAAGPLSLEIAGGQVRAVRWQGLEVVRGIDFLVRDPDWGTWLAEGAEAETESGVGRFVHRRRFSVAGGALDCRLVVEGEASGRVTVAAEMTARRAVTTNRAGLTVLHPIESVAGETVLVRHTGGTEEGRFPTLISPSQPVFDIRGLRHRVGPVEVDIAFEGEVFEMEDQRNWTDASYKTYCRPLSRPTPYRIEEGETVRQSVVLTLKSAGAEVGVARASEEGPGIARLNEAMPETLFAIEPGWLPESTVEKAAAHGSGIGRYLVRTTAAEADGLFEPVASLKGRGVDLEVVLPDTAAEAKEALGAVASSARKAGIAIDRVIALPAAYLKSYQPDGRWPDGLSPAAAIALARAAFPGAAIGGGMLTNFTEFNRHRPDPGSCDYLTHGTTAIVHAADDRSVMETLEALPHVFASARAIGGEVPYRLGLVSIGMRSNPYGADVADNPGGVRMPMARSDPRQKGLFAASWAVGAFAATAGHRIDAVALAAPAGPFGIAEGSAVRPIAHAVRALAAGGKRRRLALTGLPPAVAAVAFERGQGMSAVLANLRPEPVPVDVPEGGTVRLLDDRSFAEASRDPSWLDGPATSVEGRSVTLRPLAVAFIDWKRMPQ